MQSKNADNPSEACHLFSKSYGGDEVAGSLFYSFNPTTCHLDGTWAMGKFNIEPHHDQGLITVG